MSSEKLITSLQALHYSGNRKYAICLDLICFFPSAIQLQGLAEYVLSVHFESQKYVCYKLGIRKIKVCFLAFNGKFFE